MRIARGNLRGGLFLGTTVEGPVVTIEELKASVGIEPATIVSPPISANDIRKLAIAVYWPEEPPRLFWDEDYAAKTKWQGIIAPQEFNPFAWPVSGPGRLADPPGRIAGGRAFNAGSEMEYGVPMRPGDVITATDHIAEVYERRGRTGRLLFAVAETVWHNQRGEFVKRMRGSLVHVLPEGES